MPQIISFARKLSSSSLTRLKPSSPDRERSRPYIRNATPTKMMMPLIRCRIEVMAGSGKWNLPRSRFTGRSIFTSLSHSLLVPRNRENRRPLVRMLGPENQYDTGNRLVHEGGSQPGSLLRLLIQDNGASPIPGYGL